MTGTGATAVCASESSAAFGTTCPSPYKTGSCSSTGLAGCCVTTTAGTTTAACYYDATTASAVKSACTGTWQTTAP
jgi:hypothetical protein